MGAFRHEAIVVVGFDEAHVQMAREKALELFQQPDRVLGDQTLVSPLTGSWCNGFASFMVAPDGSKLGWDASDHCKAQRGELKAWLRKVSGDLFLDWVEVSFGGDYGPEVGAVVLDHCDAEEGDG